MASSRTRVGDQSRVLVRFNSLDRSSSRARVRV
jgi:hypothetical protein